jgi:orotate phosphoribosyltransferase
VKVCVLVVVLILDYSKLDKEMACLEQQENNVDVVEVATLEALLTARAKKNYLQKQRKLLVRYEQQWMDKSS